MTAKRCDNTKPRERRRYCWASRLDPTLEMSESIMYLRGAVERSL